MAREPGTRVEIDPELEARVFRVAEEYVDALLRGESPEREAYLRAHPDLRDDLEVHLKLVDLLHRFGKHRA